MGGNLACLCRRTDSEEEYISKIFNSMNLRNLEINEIYFEFLNCMIEDKIEIEKDLYNNFLCKIVNPRDYREAQVDYFENLLEINGNKINGIKRIGALIIMLSNGSYSDKISYLEKHIYKYYGKSDRNVKEFISDLVEMNTDICLVSFKKYIDPELYKSVAIIWKKQRKQKLINKIFTIYEELKLNEQKEFNGKYSSTNVKEMKSLLNIFLNTSYNNLTGESIRAFLYEEYINENNKFIGAKDYLENE
jgi:hypothetical protein